MGIGVKIHNHACMDWGFFTDIPIATREKNHEEQTQSSHLTGGQL
jgi:hypothetical protein